MTLTTHAVVGAAIVGLVPAHPEIGLTLAFASHFVLDAIPHWDYKTYDERGLKLTRIVVDGFLGMLLASIFFAYPEKSWIPLLGAVVSVIPDIFWLKKLENLFIIKKFQQFHNWIHVNKTIKNLFVGVGSQIVLTLAVILFAR